jgi:hypothetical protein
MAWRNSQYFHTKDSSFDIFEAIRDQLPKLLREAVLIQVESDPYMLVINVTLRPKRNPDLAVKAKVQSLTFKLPDVAIAEICLLA